MTTEEFKEALPNNLRLNVNTEVLAHINATLSEPDMEEAYRENMLGYTDILLTGKFKMTDYVNAIKYISYKARDKTNLDAYTHTFPHKVSGWQARGVSAKDIASYVSSYHGSKLVTKLLGQAMIPIWLVNQENLQRAINVQVEIMEDLDVSPKVRVDAANSVMTHLKAPEVAKVELDITVQKSSAVEQLEKTVAGLAAQQLQSLEQGMMNIEEVAHQQILSSYEVEEGVFVPADDASED